MSVIYTIHDNPKAPGYNYKGYRCNGRLVSPKRIPKYALERFEMGSTKVEYDNKPELPRCLFCDAYKTHERRFQNVMVALCGDHYYSRNIGQIAQELRKQGEQHGGSQSQSTPQGQQSESGDDGNRRRDSQANRASGPGPGHHQ